MLPMAASNIVCALYRVAASLKARRLAALSLFAPAKDNYADHLQERLHAVDIFTTLLTQQDSSKTLRIAEYFIPNV